MQPAAAGAVAAVRQVRLGVEGHPGTVRGRTGNEDGGLRRHRDLRAGQPRSVPCGHLGEEVRACIGRGAAVVRTADGTDSGRTGRSFADGRRSRLGDSRGVEDRRVGSQGIRSVAMACPGGVACAAAYGDREEAADVLAAGVVGDAEVGRLRSAVDRGRRDHRGVESVEDSQWKGLEPGPVLRLRTGLRLEEDQPGERELVVAE